MGICTINVHGDDTCAVVKKTSPSLLITLRTRRKVSRYALHVQSGIADSTIKRLENGVGSPQGHTWHRVLESLAEVSPFSADETAWIQQEAGIPPEVVETINRRARPAQLADGRKTARSRIRDLIDTHPEHTERFADLLEAAARLIGPP